MVPLVWGGCVAALAGGVLMTSSRADSGAGGALASGDLLLVAAAVMWSLQVPHPLGPLWDPSARGPRDLSAPRTAGGPR